MKTKFAFVCIALVCLFVDGCATPVTQSKFTADTVPQIKTGMTKSQVTDILGQPRSRSTDSDGLEFWQYRKNGTEGKGMKTYIDIVSMGTTSGQDAEFQDILTVMFKSDAVSKVTYEENVRSASGLGKH